MNILLTNAEGYTARSLGVLRNALIQSGFNVLTMAPVSGAASLSRAISDQNSLVVERAGGDDRHPIFSVEGTAADCVRVAILSGLGSSVSAVISGIGEGANIGDDASYSASFGAAIEGGLLGYPAMAIFQQIKGRSCCDGGDEAGDFNWASAVGAELAAWLAASPPPGRSVLNVNVPAHLAHRGVKLTTFSERIWEPLEWEQTGSGAEASWLVSPGAYGQARYAAEPGSDALALDNGHVSVTPLSLDQRGGRSAVAFRSWLRSTIEQMNPRLGATHGTCSAGCCG